MLAIWQKILEIIKNKIISTKHLNIIKDPISHLGYNLFQREKAFGIMITASHFPKNYNGFKFFYNGIKISKKMMKYKKISTKNKFKLFKDRKITNSILISISTLLMKNLNLIKKTNSI